MALVCATGLMLLLSGCETAYMHGPYELGFDGENLLVAACEDRNVSTVYLEERPDVPGVEGRRHVWEATGDVSIAAGEILVVGGDNPGLLTTDSVKPAIEPGTRYFVEMNEEPGRVTSALFRIPEDGLFAGEWVTPEGDESSEPCSGSGADR